MLSVICPVYNEAKFITKLLEFFLAAEPQEKELIIVDGSSTDGTQSIVAEYAKSYNNIVLLKNERRYVPYALNMGIAHARGNVIVRLDAHTEYAKDYFEQVIKTFAETQADIVGGPMKAIGKNNFQKAVAYATSTPMGVGNSRFHFENYSGYTDSVYLGAWKKEIFSVVGYFDEQMKRNQDDEFHYRAKSKGFKIYQNNAIRSYYYPRDSAKKLFKQYFEYGLYKPLVLKKIKSEMKLRHLVPGMFCIYLLSLLFIQHFVWFIPLLIYTAGAIFYAFRIKFNLMTRADIFISFFILHIAYGSGFIIGLKKIFWRQSNRPFLPQTVQKAVY